MIQKLLLVKAFIKEKILLTVKAFMVKYNNYFLGLGFILFLFAAILGITSPRIWQAYDLTNTGQIGDTIGGITAPFINLLGALLVYISFKEQNRANKIQSEQNSFILLHGLFKELKAEFSNLTFSTKSVKDGKIYKGSKAQSVFIEILTSRINNTDFQKNSFFKEYLFLMGNITIFIDIVHESTASEKEKKYVLRLFHFLYLAKIKTQLLEILELTQAVNIHEDFNSLLADAERKIETSYTTYFNN